MDPIRIAIRALLSFVFLLVLLRVAGKTTLHHATSFDFVLALIVGDLVDDVLWSEVPVAQFAVAASTLVLAKLSLTFNKTNGVPSRA